MSHDYRPVKPLDDREKMSDQAAPMMDWLPIDSLVVDDAYQRPLGAKNLAAIRQIAKNFRWSRFTPVLVAPVEGGKYAIIDGQHRTHAAASCGAEAVPCMIVHMTRMEQASAFAWVNGNVTAMTVFHVYKAALAAMEPWALQARSAVEAAGCTLMTYNKSASQKRAGEIYALGLVRHYVDAGHSDLITDCLGAIRKTDTEGVPELYNNLILKPWFSAAQSFDVDGAALEGFCRTNDLLDIIERCALLRKTPEWRGMSSYQIGKRSIEALLRRHLASEAA